MNVVEFDFTAGSEPGYASVSPGSDLWAVSVYASVDPGGLGINRFGLNETIFETPLVSGSPFMINDAKLQLNLDDFVCPSAPLYLCVHVDRNDDAVPVFTFEAQSYTLRTCKVIKCKGRWACLIFCHLTSKLYPTVRMDVTWHN